MILYHWLQRTVKAKGGSKALIYRDTYLSWRGLQHRVDRRAQELKSIGIRPGDIVGLMLGNVPDLVILTLSLGKIKAIALPLDPTTSTRDLELLMSITPVRALVTRPRGGDAPLPTAPAGQVKTGRRKGAPESRRRLQGTLLTCAIYPCEPRQVPSNDSEQLEAVIVTGDSAGDPKPVERTHENIQAEAEQLVSTLKLSGDDRVLLTVPMFHSFGFDVGIVGALACGATLVLEDEIGAAAVIKLVREKQITLLPGGKTLFAELARLPSVRPITHKPLRFLSLGGGLDGATLEAFFKKYGAKPLGYFHTSETASVSIDSTGASGKTVGKLLPGVRARVTDPESGKSLGAGRKGCLWIRSAAVSPLGIVNGTTSDDETIVGSRNSDGWYRTGDIASVDRSKRITLHAREDDLVRLDGKRIALGEVEGCLETFPKVSEARAELITDPLGGPMVVARVVVKDRKRLVEPEHIIDHCARNLAPYKVPRRVEICEKL